MSETNETKNDANPPAKTSTAAPVTVKTPQGPMTNEQVLDAVGKQIEAIDLQTVDTEAAKAWLKEFRVPLASMATNTIVDLIKTRAAGVSDAALEAAYAKLKPAELNAVMKANVATIDKLASQAAKEAALIRLTQEKLTTSAASFAMNALMKVLGVAAV